MADENEEIEETVERTGASLENLRIEEQVLQSSLTGYVGFDSLTNQLETRSLKRGFELNLMVVGPTGSGKSTFVNTLFQSHLIDPKGTRSSSEQGRKTTQIEHITHMIEEKGVRLKLTIIDTPGFGDLINNDNSWEPILQYIQDQYYIYHKEESSMQRKRYIRDTRVHVVLYFIQPTGQGLKPLDIEVMKKISEVANLVPVIAKSDSLTLDERKAFKDRIQEEIAFHKIKVYPASSDGEYDQAEQARNNAIMKLVPFAVVGSEKNIVVNGKSVRGRRHGWGVINIESEEHCDFVQLRDFLIKSHLLDLIETTKNMHYETYRTHQLQQKKKRAAEKKDAKLRK